MGKKYQDNIISVFADYTKGTTQYMEVRGKTFGAGYEVFIIAFFIGLYFNQTKTLVEDKAKKKVFGHPIMYWGNIENKAGRKAYADIRRFMFVALIARTDIDFITLDKGEIKPSAAVDALMKKMEEYANFGFDYIKEKLEDVRNYFFKDKSFLKIFTSFIQENEEDENDNDEPESLD